MKSFPLRHPLRALASLALAALPALRGFSQEAPPPPPVVTQSGTQPPADSTIVLSPFEVDATKEQGYFSPTTLAGTRLNSNIADLPSSISVITKQQLEDTGARNINDVFMYEANVEGSRTYTVADVNRNGVHDDLAGYDNGSNNTATTSAVVNSTRVRGLGVPDLNINNNYSANRIPFDTYNIQSVEIERGPNSIIFGSGSPAGIVNASLIEPTLHTLSGEASVQFGSWGAFRETAGLNVPLLPDRLGLYVSQVYDSAGFERRPAKDQTRRQYIAFSADPFKNHKTHISASAEFYDNYANDENTLTPTDYVTPWLEAGKPVYNPINDTVTYLSTGKQVGPYAFATTDPNYAGNNLTQANLTNSASPFFVPSLAFASNRPTVLFANNREIYGYGQAQATGLAPQTGTQFAYPTAPTAAQALIHAQRLVTTTALPVPANIAAASWSYTGVTDKNIYNWMDGPNIDSLNSAQTHTKQFYIDVAQEILPNLNADLQFFRQEISQVTNDPVGQVSPVSISVDATAYLPNGTPNPYVGVPIVADSQNDTFVRPEKNQNWRGSLEYTLKLEDKVPSWLEWLGHHRLMTVYSKHDDWNETDRYRAELDGGEPGFLPTAAITGTTPANNWSYPGNGSGYQQWYYLGSPGSTAITQSGGVNGKNPSFGGQNTFQFTNYNYTTGQWVNTTEHASSYLFFAGTQGDSENIQDQKTYFVQSFLFDDRLVGTVGANHDEVSNRQTTFPANTYQDYANGVAIPSTNYLYTPYQYVGGNTFSYGLVARPFSHWGYIDRQADDGNIAFAILRSIGVTFNKSDNFNPPNGFQTDYFGHPLGKPQGVEKDYGFEIATPDHKVFVKMTWYKGTNENAPNTSVAGSRVLYTDITELKNWATAVVEIRNGQNPTTDPNFGNTAVYPITATEQTQISQLMALPYNYTFGVNPKDGTPATQSNTQTSSSKGIDLDLIYNPLPNWTMKLTGGKQISGVTQVEPQAQAYVAYRMAGDPTAKGYNPNGLPAWTAYAASDLSKVITTYNGGKMYLGTFWNGYGFDGQTPYNGTNGGPTTSGIYYQNVAGSVLAGDVAAQGTRVPNEREYTVAYINNYIFDRGPVKGLNVGGGITWQSNAIVGYYGSTTTLNSAGQIYIPDLTKPIYTPAQAHYDAWIGYTFNLPWSNGKYKAKVQLNVYDIASHGYILPITYNYDGTPGAYRIIPPRQWSLRTTVNF